MFWLVTDKRCPQFRIRRRLANAFQCGEHAEYDRQAASQVREPTGSGLIQQEPNPLRAFPLRVQDQALQKQRPF